MNQFSASLWGDEAFSAILSSKSIPEIIKISLQEPHPPLFNILENLWFRLFGSSEVAIRLLTFILLLVTVYFVYKIGEYLWDKKTATFAALLTLLNPFLFAYGFEGRMYSLLVATTTASFYFFLKRRWSFYVIATTLALYAQHYAFFAFFVQGLVFLKEYTTGKKKLALTMLKSFLVVLLLYSPWLIPLYNQTKLVGEGFWLGRPTSKDLITLFVKYLNLSLILLLIRNWAKDFKKSLILILWATLPIFLAWGVSQKFTPIFFDRYLIYTIPAAMLLAASQRRPVANILMAVVLGAFLLIDSIYFTNPSKRPFRELAAYVKEVRRGDDLIINWNSTAHHLWEAKYYGIPAPLYVPAGRDKLPFFVGTALMAPEDVIETLPKKVNRVGVITSGPVEEITIASYTKKEEKVFDSLKVIWLTKNR
ncbi:MAG: glycosyltransferase family 39 protein [Patescibacteria group bacterium]